MSYDIDKYFDHHEISKYDQDKINTLRNFYKAIASKIDLYLPECREKAIALTKLEESMFFTNAGISRNSKID